MFYGIYAEYEKCWKYKGLRDYEIWREIPGLIRDVEVVGSNPVTSM